MATGIVRQIDNLGRICIPREMMRHLGWQPEDQILVTNSTADGNLVVTLTKYGGACYICGETLYDEQFLTVRKKNICLRCAKEIVEAEKGE